nr:C. briggsae CBR-SPD-1 protein [Haemonchus contortus]
MVSPFRIGKTVNPRRLSINDSFHDVVNNVRGAIDKLNGLWDEVHMSEAARTSRVNTAFEHICSLLNDMVQSEECMIKNVGIEISDGLRKINRMRSQLGMEQWENKRAPPGSIELRNSINAEIRKLLPLFETRQNEQAELIDRLHHLCFRLGIDDSEFSIPTESDELISGEKLGALDARRLELEDVLHKRVKKVQKWQKELNKFVKKLGNDALSEDEDLRSLLSVDFANEETSVPESVVDTLEEYYGRWCQMYTEYVQEREFRWLELYSRVSELWEACHVADIERLIPACYNPDKHTDRDIEKISTEISRLESLYAARKDVFDVLTAWKEKWAEKLALEEKKKDPEYFQNRGRENNVYLDAKIERTLNDHTIPKLMRKLISAYEEYRQSHPGDDIRVDGLTPPDYVKFVLDEYNASKEIERKNRQMHRMVSTSAMKTPQSARLKLQPRPVSSSKIEPLRKRLRYDSTLYDYTNTSTASIVSTITPTKRFVCF